MCFNCSNNYLAKERLAFMNVFVGCSSRDTDNELYNRVAEEIGNFIVKGKHNLVFGGSNIGLMGKVYSAVAKSTESKIIISTVKVYEYHLPYLTYSQAHVFETVNERKSALLNLSEILVFIPGGIGTIDELFSAIEARRAHEHESPIIIVNANNFFGHLLDMLNQIYDERFADSKTRELYYIANTLEEALEHLSKLTTHRNNE